MEKPKKPNAFDRAFQNRPFQVAVGVVALVLAYVFASWAIDTGSLLDYAITLVLMCIGLRELALAIMGKRRGR